MPIRFIVGGAMIVAGGFGIKKIARANETLDEAKRYVADANELIEDTNYRLELQNERTDDAITALGTKKLKVLEGTLDNFIKVFSNLKYVRMKKEKSLLIFNPKSAEYSELAKLDFSGTDLVKCLGVGGLSGGVFAFGAYGIAEALAEGGALAISGGSLVLGSVIVGPALLIGSFFAKLQTDTALEKAKMAYQKAKAYEAEVDLVCTKLEAIVGLSEQQIKVIHYLDTCLRPLVKQMKAIQRKKKVDWRKYTDSEKTVVKNAVHFAQTIKIVLDAPLITKEGKIEIATEKIIDSLVEEFAIED